MKELTYLSRQILLDRYALKTQDRDTYLKPNCLVLAVTDKKGTRDLATVKEVNGRTVTVELQSTHEALTLDKNAVDIPMETRPEQIWERVARHLSSIEEEPEYWEKRFYEALDGFKFVPGGRILAWAGGAHKVTPYNCLSGDTFVMTEEGPQQIRELQGGVRVHTMDGVNEATFRSYGEDELFEITISNGEKFKATANHRWPVQKVNYNGIEWVTTVDLQGRKLVSKPTWYPDLENQEVLDGIQHGIIYGDGTVQDGRAFVCLFGEKKKLTSFFPGKRVTPHYDGKYTTIYGLDPKLKEVPSQYESHNYWYGFFLGLLATNGDICSRQMSVTICQATEEGGLLLKKMAHKLWEMGIAYTSVSEYDSVSPFNGEPRKLYWFRIPKQFVNPDHLIREDQQAVFLQKKVSVKKTCFEVLSIEPTGEIEEVYCCEEPITTSFVISGSIWTGNCFAAILTKDTVEGVFHTLDFMVETMSRGGGVGIQLGSIRPQCAGNNRRSLETASKIRVTVPDSRGGIVRSICRMASSLADGHEVELDFSSLRPRFAPVLGVNGRSSGAASWTSLALEVVEIMNGSYGKGRLSVNLHARHPDLPEMINDIVPRMERLGVNFKLVGELPEFDLPVVFEFPDRDDENYSRYRGELETWEGKTISYNVLNWSEYIDLLSQIHTPYQVEEPTLKAKPAGAVEWGRIYSFATGQIEQGGARRGALMLMLPDWHPEVLKFINYKREIGKLTNANISVCVSNALMKAIEDDAEWVLEYPDTTCHLYDAEWDGDLKEWKKAGRPTIVYEKRRAREIWKAICESAWASAEPGILFSDKVDKDSPSSYYKEGKIIVTNPCVTGDTLVETDNGQRRILEIVGQSVRLKLRNQMWESPEGFFSTGVKPVLRLTTEEGHSLRLTKDHLVARFFSNVCIGWVPAGALIKGDLICADNETATVAEVTPDGEEEVYDVSIPGVNAFVANGITVHNCGEEPLPGASVCLLGALNLSQFTSGSIGTAMVDWENLKRTIESAVRMLDNVIDLAWYHDPRVEAQQRGERRAGLGIMGLAELLIRCGLRYGSQESVEFVDQLMAFIKEIAYETSIDLAEEKGPFPWCIPALHIETGFCSRLPEDLKEGILESGIRNVTLLTCAPTGSTGSLVGTSTGLEPYFNLTWIRNGRLGSHVETARVVDEWKEQNPGIDRLPDYFVTAMGLTPEEHALMQCTVQRHIDAAVSKSCNFPSDATVEDVEKYYQNLYKLGAKGGTIYRDGSRDEQVLYNIITECPKCSSKNVHREGRCTSCDDCGWSKCDL